jgi:hypothetical protein
MPTMLANGDVRVRVHSPGTVAGTAAAGRPDITVGLGGRLRFHTGSSTRRVKQGDPCAAARRLNFLQGLGKAASREPTRAG